MLLISCKNRCILINYLLSNQIKFTQIFHEFKSTVYRVILARWKFWLYWRMTKKRQIKKRQFFQPQNLEISEIKSCYGIMPSYLSINTLNTHYLICNFNTLNDHVNWPWCHKGMLLLTWLWVVWNILVIYKISHAYFRANPPKFPDAKITRYTVCSNQEIGSDIHLAKTTCTNKFLLCGTCK